jgi:hypothetical protein
MRYRVLFLPLLVLLSACDSIQDLSDLKGVKASRSFALPLIDSRSTIGQFMEAVSDTGTIEVAPNGQLSLLYRQNIINEGSEELLNEIKQYLPITVPVLSTRQELPFSQPGQVELDRVELGGGSLAYLFQWTRGQKASVEITVPQMTREGEALRLVHSLPAASPDDPYNFFNALLGSQVDGYVIQPEDGSIFIEYKVVTADGSQAMLDNFIFRIESLVIPYVEGYLAPLRYDTPEGSFDINLYENWSLGSIFFEEPSASLLVRNSIGLPVRALIEKFTVVSVDGEEIELEGPPVSSGIDIPYPELDQAGEVVSSIFTLDKDNSNLQEIISSQPMRIDYKIDALTNPDGDTDIRGFVTDTGSFVADLEIQLPMYGKVDDFIARDTVGMDFSEYRNIDFAEFRLVSENELPLDVHLQAYFTDLSGSVLDSLYDEPALLLHAAPVDEQGFASGVVREETISTLSAEAFDRIRPAVFMVIVLQFDTHENGGGNSVRLLNDQSVQIRMGVVFSYFE